MTISSKLLLDVKIIKNPTVIPRIGDKIDMGFAPLPKVTDVVWTFDDNMENQSIYVITE